MSSNIAVSVRGLSKSYTIAHNAAKYTTAAEALVSKLRNPFQKTERETFWALKDIEFDIKKGDVVGIIGRNGAGKSTLLKVLSRITEPTTGSIALYGRVGSLLEVGTGFHPELTGRENIFLSGAILGMSKREIAHRFDAIVDFAGVEQFIDTPVKRYSSGMYVRLAFAVAAHLDSQILLVDEVLAVGDLAFQQKCLNHMKCLTTKGVTILLVSHNMAAIQSCCRSAIYLENGKFVTTGAPLQIVEQYRAALQGTEVDHNNLLQQGEIEVGVVQDVTITGFQLINEDGVAQRTIKFGERVRIRIDVEALRRVEHPLITFGIKRGDGVIICNFNNVFDNFEIDYIEGKCSLEGWLPPFRLVPDYYEIHVLVWPNGGQFQGDMLGARPLASKTFGDFSVNGPGLTSSDGVFQLPAEKWRFSRKDHVIEYDQMTPSSLEEACYSFLGAK